MSFNQSLKVNLSASSSSLILSTNSLAVISGSNVGYLVGSSLQNQIEIEINYHKILWNALHFTYFYH